MDFNLVDSHVAEIKTATLPNSNTAAKVGGTMEEMVDKIKEVEAERASISRKVISTDMTAGQARLLVPPNERCGGYNISRIVSGAFVDEYYNKAYTNESDWMDSANWDAVAVNADGYSFVSDAEIAKLNAYPTLSGEQNKFVRADGSLSELSVGSGGYAANVYLNAAASDIAGYKAMTYNNDLVKTTVSGSSVNNIETLIEEFAYPSQLGVTDIDAGVWRFMLNGLVSNTGGETRARIKVYKRSLAGVEAELFIADSVELNNLVDDKILFESIQPQFITLATDRIVIKLFVVSTSNASKTLTINIGGANGSYFNTPLALRHNQLRGVNEDTEVQHMTVLEKSTLGQIKTKTVTFTTDVATTRKLVTLSERVNGYKLSYSNKTEQYIGTLFTDVEWIKDSNWRTFETQNNKDVASGYAGLNDKGFISKTRADKSFGYVFNGVNQYATIPHDAKLNFGTGGFTIQILLTLNPSGNIERILSKYDRNPPYAGIEISKALNNKVVMSLIQANGSAVYPQVSKTITKKEMVSVFIVVLQDRVNMYLNGVLDSITSFNLLSSLDNTSPILLSKYQQSDREYLGGGIHIIRAFNRALSQVDVTYYENGGRPDLQRLRYTDKTNCVLELLPENALLDKWLESQNGLHAITTNNPAIGTETPVTDYSLVDNITNNIAVGAANRDYTLPAGYIVDSVCVNSSVALTALQLVNISNSENLLTGKSIASTTNKHLPITADQSSARVDTTIRLNASGNTGLGFNIVINLKKCL